MCWTGSSFGATLSPLARSTPTLPEHPKGSTLTVGSMQGDPEAAGRYVAAWLCLASETLEDNMPVYYVAATRATGGLGQKGSEHQATVAAFVQTQLRSVLPPCRLRLCNVQQASSSTARAICIVTLAGCCRWCLAALKDPSAVEPPLMQPPPDLEAIKVFAVAVIFAVAGMIPPQYLAQCKAMWMGIAQGSALPICSAGWMQVCCLGGCQEGNTTAAALHSCSLPLTHSPL